MHVDLVVPAYNEAGNLRKMVDRTVSTLRAERDGWTFGVLLVVSDGSTDGTQELAAELDETYPEVSRLVRTENFGFGNAVRDGLAHADGDVLIPFMADLSDDPADVPNMIAEIEAGYDVVYGSRFADSGSVDGYPPLKLLYNRAFNNAVRLLFGLKERDVTNAFTAYRAAVIDEIGMETLASESFDVTAELPLRATVEGFRSTEVPVSWQSREAGVSNLDATRKGPVYARRVLEQFIRGNAAGLRDLFGAVSSQSWTRIVGAALLGVVLLVGLFSLTGFDEVYEVLARVDPVFVAAIAVIYPVSFLFRAWRWRVLLRASGHLASRANAFRGVMTGWFINHLIPARAGDVVRAYALKTTDRTPFGVSLSTIVIERVLDMFVLGAMMTTVVIFFLRSNQTVWLAVGAFAIGGAALFGLLAVYVIGDRVANALGDRFPSVVNLVRTIREGLTEIGENPYALGLCTVLSAPIWVIEVSTIYLASRAVGVELSALGTVAAGVSAFISQAAPITPGGVGTYEAAIVSVLTVFSVSSSTATALALVDHFTRLAVIYIVGPIAVIHLVFQSRPYFRDQQQSGTEDTHEMATSDDNIPKTFDEL